MITEPHPAPVHVRPTGPGPTPLVPLSSAADDSPTRER
ncbi:hypothetical protein A3Q37_03459 [Streptomyces sp. PTY087I2]|nr:hypothetical protein A3Q37_03459 [Streptomyces sp. PTY087I2]